MSREPNPRRFALWAASLVLPLVLAAVALPLVRRHLSAAGSPVGQAGATARAAEGAAAERARQADAALGAGPAAGAAQAPPPPPGRDGPTGEEIEADRAAKDELYRAQRSWRRSETMAPRQATRAGDGALVAPFQGFGLSVESTPAGATVRVDGRDLGQTPLVAAVDCAPGAALTVRLERPPLRPVERTVRCRADALLTLRVALGR